jgi:HisJ family histidinol phosphate phosphatase
LNDSTERDPRLFAIPDTHGHAKGEHKPYAEERPLPLTARMLFLWFYHACRRGYPRFLMVADHMNYLTFEDPAAVNLVRRALKLAQAGDLYGAAETAGVDVGHAAVVSEGLRRGMRYSIGAEVDNDPRSRPDAQNIVDAMRPDAIIRSVHFIPIAHPVHGENWPWPFDNPEFAEFFDAVGTDVVWETYVNALVDAIERLPGHIVGHFFVPAVFGHWPDDAKLEVYEDRVLTAAGARQMAVEFNTRFLYRDHSDEEKRRYLDANRRFLRKAKERGVGIAVGSDAHSPKDQGGAFDIVLDLLDELEINEIIFPLGGSLRRVALRVVREPEPEPVPEPPAPPPPEPARVAAREVAAESPAAPKPVRKARTTSKPVRSDGSSAERPPERPEPPATAPEPPATPPAVQAATEDAAPVTPKPAARKTASKAPSSAAPAAPPPPPAAPKPPAKVAAAPVKPAPKTAAKAAPKPAAAAAARAPAKAAKPAAAPVRTIVAKKSAAAGSKARSQPVAAKTGAKRPAKPPAKRAALAKKAAPAKKATSRKPAAKKPIAARGPAKKAAPAKKKLSKKAVTKKAQPARKAPARKANTAKKTTAKKAVPKRR